jgi:addiction module HigA family antidote
MLSELYFEPLKLSIKQVALKLNISHAELLEIIKGKVDVSESIAMKLSKTFKTTSQFWLNMQNNYNAYNKLKSN